MSKQNKTFGGHTSPNLPLPIIDRLAQTKLFNDVRNRKVQEERRLLYVGFTRAKDYLVTLGNEKTSFTWPMLCNAAVNNDPVDDKFALWHPNFPSTLIELPLPDEAEGQEASGLHPWTFAEPSGEAARDKYQSPSLSGHQTSVPVTLTEVFKGEKMVQNITGEESAISGTCVHHIFAAYNPDMDRNEMTEMAKRIIGGMGLTEEFPNPESVINSAEQFFKWLREKYGAGTPLHELPVVMRKDDGTIIRGEMDLVLELPDKKCVLIDYKSYHGYEDFNTPEARGGYYGYASQLKPYKDTLESAGYEVCDTLIYYFVQGRVVRFDFK
jgi:ATP-dependent exoDNAse (exonuclease V) beta subunit